MSSINQLPNGASIPTNRLPATGETGAASQTTGTNTVGGIPPAGLAGVPTDGYAREAGQATDVTRTAPPVATESRPINYTTNLEGAKQNLSAYSQTGSVGAAEAALLAEESSAKSRAADKDSAEAESRKKKVSSQASSIVDSAETSHKAGCKTKYDNHDANVSKMQKLGFTKPQSETLIKAMEDGRTSADTKSKIAYQLAALGMTGGTSTKVNAAIAGNAGVVKKQLADLADMQSKGPGAGAKAAAITATVFTGGLAAGGVAGAFAPTNPLGNKNTQKVLDSMTIADMSTKPAPTAETNGGTMGSFSSADLLSPVKKEVDATSSATSSAISPTTQNQAAIQSAALSGAYQNLS